MTVPLSRWGNSLAVRLPRGIIQAAGLQEGDRVSIQVEDGTIVMRPAKPKYTLDELLKQTAPDVLHGEVDLGPPRGVEDVW